MARRSRNKTKRRQAALARWYKALDNPSYTKKDYAKDQIALLEAKLANAVYLVK